MDYVCKLNWRIIMSEQQDRKARKVLPYITVVDEKTWVMPSASDDTKTHTVTYRDGIEVTGDYDCDCLGFQYSMNCYHIMAVELFKKNNQSRELASDIK